MPGATYQPHYPSALALKNSVTRLRKAISSHYHQFLPDSISRLDEKLIDHRKLLSPHQLIDIFLLALAVKNDCHFFTFDQWIPSAAARESNRYSLAWLAFVL